MKGYLKRVVRAICNKTPKYKAEHEYRIITEKEPELTGKVAFVTGGSGTLGRSICHILAAHGAKIYVGGRNKQKVDLVVNEIGNKVAKSIIIDITDEEAVKQSIKKIIAEEGKLDILVNCAGGSARNKMADLSDQDIDIIQYVLTSNLLGTMICSKYAIQEMKQQERGGCVINIASTSGVQGNSGNCDYSAAKSGVIGFTKALAQEVGTSKIRVNCVSPGFIQTGEFDDAKIEYLQRTNFLRTVGEPEDIANAVEFLASDRAKFITGINLVVDGGRILGLHTMNC